MLLAALLMFLLFSLIPSSHLAAGDLECSRAISRRVSHAIQLLLRNDPRIKRSMSSECLLTPEMHIYNKEEAMRTVFPTGKSQCGFCGKTFQEEKAYDEHMEEIHNSSQEGEFICLEKFCGFFGECEEKVRIKICKETSQVEEISDLCSRVISGCFPQTNKDSKFYGAELTKRFCLREKVLIVNGCLEKHKEKSLGFFELALFHFSKFLLFAIIVVTIAVSYKVNELVNKIK
ncbi:zinc finger protein [Cryptosporidium felis]|nr:zinc finger protein [Cryptosporidium felis]